MKVAEIAEKLEAELLGDGETDIGSVRGVSDAEGSSLTFLTGKKYLSEVAGSNAAAVLVDRFYDELGEKVQLKVGNPSFAFARALELFYVKPYEAQGIMEGAYLGAEVQTGKDVTVYPFAYIDSDVIVGDRTTVYPHTYIGKGCRIGCDCVIYPGVVLREGTVLGDRVVLHANTVIGADGFGYVFEGGRHHKIPQVGTVKIGNDVEIGAGTAIDRATTGVTEIGEGTRIDNMVQIGHNVKTGKHCIIVAQVGIAGSSSLGDYVTLGGQVGIADHAVIESGTMAAAKSGLMGTVKKGIYAGGPAFPHRQWLKAQAIYERLPELVKQIRELENKVKQLEEKNDD